jgi:DNA repair protein RecN (Recombination protein N)
MLRYLRIRNLAVIEAVDVEFQPGFNVLTGETGAGKSILVEAVGLLLGARASSDLVRTGEPQASIEAIFEADDGRELIVRREITNQGRSRSFINGALATAGALRELSQRLVELHGQHEHQALLDPSTHLPTLDGFGQLEPLADRVASAWTAVRLAREQLDRSRMDSREKAARLELIAFQLGEIEKAGLKPGEDDELAGTRQILASAERVRGLCDESYATLYDSEQAVLAGLGNVWKRVAELATIDPQFATHLEARDGIKSQLEDLALFLRSYGESVDASPERLQEVEDRLALIERLKRKYGPTLQDVIDAGQDMRRERELLSGASQAAADLDHQLSAATGTYLTEARELSRKRHAASERFAAGVENLLAELAMARTRFEVRFKDTELPPDLWNERGIDQAEFFVSPNPGEDLRPLAKIVSGGELSRVMLALKTLAAADAAGKTLIFDEVDAGIGGRVADVVGTKLRQLGEKFQVLCITHLPQIAALATTQFRIEKAVRGRRTVTSVECLEQAGRVEEIARMMGGMAISDSIRASAEELLSSRPPAGAKGKYKAKGESESRRRG